MPYMNVNGKQVYWGSIAIEETADDEHFAIILRFEDRTKLLHFWQSQFSMEALKAEIEVFLGEEDEPAE